MAASAIMGVGLAPVPRGGAAASGAALEPPACGPAAAETVVHNREARVYLRSRRGRTAVLGCHRAGRRARFLGDRSRLRLVRLAGRYAAAVRTDDAGVDQRLVVVNLRRGRLRRRVEARRDSVGGAFVRIRLDRTGIAAYTLRLPPVDGLAGTVEVGSTADGRYARAPDIDSSVLGFAAISVAYKQGVTFRLTAFDEVDVTDGTLLRVGDMLFTAVHRRSGVRPRLLARLGTDRRPVPLGAPTSACIGSSGCSGIDALQVAGPFVAVRDGFYAAGESGGEIRVYDLARDRRRVTCRAPGLHGGVGSFVLTDSGRVACAIARDYTDASKTQISVEGAVLDQGAGIDISSLARRGDQLVWLHDGVERSAPLRAR